ncbi:hypothetical protein DN523_29340 [Burkholderia multivorans]|uniref:hypothetical protein n=1 Tax=Burkholderia multivorans TaxID=87883 RepID=UPI000DAD4CA6|nr:hypothetical protein [Burkholderia multivorans]RAA31133.1 hypothetical protein DN471_06170 [Burkholderia multivorans]RAA32589.1 hypothetical protein DN470_01360 [Burkholderia multivorans]RAA37286.1 hypothetical protein DN465_06085 [Burkholderia multivorans]RAA38161.1 hypothetical protein DN472_26600 [Burkholderia multivorans]RAA41846.1 hypothetical protein DN500_18750 [Burkholderia multivorans]
MQILLETADTENTSPIKYFGVGESAVFITNHNTQKCQRNFATGAIENGIVGTVPITEDYASLTSQSNYVQTGIAEVADMSIFSVFRSAAFSCFAASNYMPTGNQGIGLWIDSFGKLSFFASRDDGTGKPTLSNTVSAAATASNAWILASGTTGPTVNMVRNHTANTSVSSTITGARMTNANPIRIGSSWGGPSTGACDHLITVIVPRLLTADQTTSLVTAMRTYAAKHGITV